MGVIELMDKASDRYIEKGKEYGHTYERFGEVMMALFPDGLLVTRADDWNRLGLLTMMVHKLLRYTNLYHDPKRGAEELDDMAVYTFILESIDNDSL